MHPIEDASSFQRLLKHLKLNFALKFCREGARLTLEFVLIGSLLLPLEREIGDGIFHIGIDKV